MAIREIIFRGKTSEGEWVYWDMFARATKNIDNTQSLNYDTYVVFYDDEQTPTFVIKREIGGFEYLDILPETISEYVGLKDKNGERIFEGDIVNVPWYNKKIRKEEKQPFHIEFEEGEFVAVPIETPTNKFINRWTIRIFGRASDFEITGNIHDNKELLGE